MTANHQAPAFFLKPCYKLAVKLLPTILKFTFKKLFIIFIS
jgi:hypothetical protein